MAEELPVTVGPENFGKTTSFSAKEIESLDDIRSGECFEAKGPVVSSGTVNKDKDIPKSFNRNGVAEPDVDVDLVKILVLCALEWLTPRGLVDQRESAETLGEFSCADPLPIASNLEEVLIVFEGVAANNAIELLGRPLCLVVGSVGIITRPNGRQDSVRVVDVFNNLIMGHGREEGKSLTL